mmetsp:Transcript_24032/g.23945  ORF Transcript_24032/g.23945 Transcript_24032/m.23945 type:complete len:102 (-) Transcript_24032:437-742(-)
MTVDSFFETFLYTKAILILMKPVELQPTLVTEQKVSIGIRKDKNSGGFFNPNNFAAQEEDEADELLENFNDGKSGLLNKLGKRNRTLTGTKGIGSRSFLTL